jgi:hypothetical protein
VPRCYSTTSVTSEQYECRIRCAFCSAHRQFGGSPRPKCNNSGTLALRLYEHVLASHAMAECDARTATASDIQTCQVVHPGRCLSFIDRVVTPSQPLVRLHASCQPTPSVRRLSEAAQGCSKLCTAHVAANLVLPCLCAPSLCDHSKVMGAVWSQSRMTLQAELPGGSGSLLGDAHWCLLLTIARTCGFHSGKFSSTQLHSNKSLPLPYSSRM